MKIEDNRVNMDNLILGLKEIHKKSVVVGVLDDESEQMKIIAGANEFGSEIHSPKAIRFMRALAGRMKVPLVKSGAKGKDVIIIPERSFLRSTIDDLEIQNRIIESMRFYLNQALVGKNTFREVLSRAGNVLRRAIQSRIKTDIPPSNHPLTVAVKGHAETLVGKTNKLITAIKSRIV